MNRYEWPSLAAVESHRSPTCPPWRSRRRSPARRRQRPAEQDRMPTRQSSSTTDRRRSCRSFRTPPRAGGRPSALVRLVGLPPSYDLVGLMVGSEGTLGIITEATVRLMPLPAAPRTIASDCSLREPGDTRRSGSRQAPSNPGKIFY